MGDWRGHNVGLHICLRCCSAVFCGITDGLSRTEHRVQALLETQGGREFETIFRRLGINNIKLRACVFTFDGIQLFNLFA